MWDAGILNGSHGRKFFRLVAFQALQRRIGDGQGTERHTLVQGWGISPGRCLLNDSGLEGGNLIAFDGRFLLIVATSVSAIVLLIRGHDARRSCGSCWTPSLGNGVGSSLLAVLWADVRM